jgi:hypothetical protein
MAVFISFCYLDGPIATTVPTVEDVSGGSDIRKEEFVLKNLVENFVFQHKPVLFLLQNGQNLSDC